MSWATRYIADLQNGNEVKIRPRGNSMTGKINSGQLCTIVPVNVEGLNVGDIVLCKVKGMQYLHIVKAISEEQVLIGNNKGRINGWTAKKNIYGKCIKVED
jgi:hypothetical protein